MEADLVMAGGAAIVVRVALGFLPRMVGGGFGGGCWIPGLQGGWGQPVGHLGGCPSSRGQGQFGSLRRWGGSWGWRRGLFRAVPAPGRVRFPTVGASGWGGEAAPKYGFEVSPAGA